MSCALNTFEATGRLADDACAIEARSRESRAFAEYQLNSRSLLNDENGTQQEVMLEHKNLRCFDGYGVAGNLIDMDSEVRNNDRSTRPTIGRQQLCARVFTAAPSLGRGRSIPVVESALINGQDTSGERSCSRWAEQPFDTLHPAVCRVPVHHIVPADGLPATGVSSRDIARSPEFLKAMGYRAQTSSTTSPGA